MEQKKLCYDVGMHTGEDTEFYLKLGYDVVAIEANPLLCRNALEKFKEYVLSGQLIILNLGIAKSQGQMIFFINPIKSEYSSFNRDIASRESLEVQEYLVTTYPLRSIFKRFGVPYYCKIDIEGFDHIAVGSLRAEDSLPRFISVENGFERDLNAFITLGYKRFSFVNQRFVAGSRYEQIDSTQEGIAWSFPRGASGAFGLDIPDSRWLQPSEVLFLINKYWSLDDTTRLKEGWFDLHARQD